MHRQQLDGRDAQVGQVLDGRLGGQPGVAAAQVLGHVGLSWVKPLTCSS